MNDREYKTGDEPISERYPIRIRDLEDPEPNYPRGSRRIRRGSRQRIKGEKFSDRVRESLKRSK